MKIILASKSPRRREILESLGVTFEVITADADERSDTFEPKARVAELAAIKGRAVLEKTGGIDNALIIACDTLVYAEGAFLGKPRDKEDARRMIKLLSGKGHQVVSGLYLNFDGREVSVAESTTVNFDPMTEEEIEAYILSDEPYDKAGAYGIQGRASVYINSIEGDYFNVVGLPVNLLCRTLKKEFSIDITSV